MVKRTTQSGRVLDARPDTIDFRDQMYVANLYEVPTRIDLDKEYRAWKVPVLNQGTEGACTGFGLATVANYLLTRRKVVPDPTPVSPRMMYEMAKRYDEWPGEDYEGSSARGAMKGWHKHGVCSEKSWPYKRTAKPPSKLTDARTSDALKRPLGAYFRVNHKDIVAMHAAMAEVGVLYATATVHEGWDGVGGDGIIKLSSQVLGGHAFAIVAYDERGLWIQNSWGPGWGREGYALVSYDDWLANGTDVWVARLGAPVIMRKAESTATAHSASAGKSASYSFSDLRPHIVSIGNNGKLSAGGDYGTSAEEVQAIFEDDFPRVTANWAKKRLLLYAHGGLVGEDSAVQRLADYRPALLEAEIYPVSFIWKSDLWSTVKNILQDALSRRRPEGVLDATKDFMLDRLDDALEPLARVASGKLQWDEMKQNALAASGKDGGARFALDQLARLAQRDPSLEIHVVNHSAGSIFLAPVVRLLTSKGQIDTGRLAGEQGYGLTVKSCTLWAPACSIDLFREMYVPAVVSGALERFALFTLTDKAEQDDTCADIYHKSLLYLVANALEVEPRIPLFRDGVPLLGMEHFAGQDATVADLRRDKRIDWVFAPNTAAFGTPAASTARRHGDFDDDRATLHATMARILEVGDAGAAKFSLHRSADSLRDKRQALQR